MKKRTKGEKRKKTSDNTFWVNSKCKKGKKDVSTHTQYTD